MPRTNLPLREADIVTWTGEFLKNSQIEPGDYGVDATQVSNYTVTRNRFGTVYGLVQNLLTKTPPNVTAKNIAK